MIPKRPIQTEEDLAYFAAGLIIGLVAVVVIAAYTLLSR